jgi:hypothetical protein
MRSASLLAAAVTLLVGAGLAAVPSLRRRAPHPAPPTSASPAANAGPPSPASAPAAAEAVTAAPPPPRLPRKPKGGMDLTFLVTADTHVGFWEKIPVPGKPSGVPLDDVHRLAIDAMNGIGGTAFPRALGGAVGAPRGLLIAGDLTEMGQTWEWARFESIFGLTGKEGWIHYPVYEGAGNHDVGYGTFVEEQIARRHGAKRYSWDWDDVHLVGLGVAPDAADLAWLRADLDATGEEIGIVLFFHYPLEGPYSRENWFAEGGYHEKLGEVLRGRRVLGIFNGHFHASGTYRWEGRDAYLVGSAKHSWHSFAVVHVTDTRWTVASYNYDRREFWWWHDKPLGGAPGREARWFSETGALVGRGR